MAGNFFQTVTRLLLMIVCLSPQLGLAEAHKVLVQVEDAQGRPVKGVEIGIEGIGGSRVTGDDGKALLALGNATKESDQVSMIVLHSPAGKDFVMVSPWDNRAAIPPFADKAENFIKVVVVQRGDKVALEDGTIVSALTARINRENAPKTPDKLAQEEDPKAALSTVAKQYGLEPEELDKQIRVWGAKTTDPYEAGLAALYERRYPDASIRLQTSLKMREEKLAADQQQVATDQRAVADSSLFLGQSLYAQGRYKESAAAYRKRVSITPYDPVALNNLALALSQSADYAGAVPLFQSAFVIADATLGHDNPTVAIYATNYATLMITKGEYDKAETLLRTAKARVERALGLDSPSVAPILSNLAGLLEEKGNYIEAERLSRRACEIDKTAFGHDSLEVATCLNILAAVLEDKGEVRAVEPLYRQALAIDENILGTAHPAVATELTGLGQLLSTEGKLIEAEPLLRLALTIDKYALDPEHPNVAICMNNLAEFLKSQGDYSGAESLLRSALAIDEKTISPDHPGLAGDLMNLGMLRQRMGDDGEAERLCRRALAIDTRTLGLDDPHTKAIQRNLEVVLESEAKKKDK